MIFFWITWSSALFIVLAFGVVVAIGAPYMPTLRPKCEEALKLLALKPGQTIVDLGCGDGVMLVAAAEHGLKAVGYEINPILAAIAWLRTRRYGGAVKVKCWNFWKADLAQADAVFVFLIGRYMKRLDNFLAAGSSGHGFKVVSHAFAVPGRKPVKKSGPFFLYHYGSLARSH